jgi:hypothetical protein
VRRQRDESIATEKRDKEPGATDLVDGIVRKILNLQ